MMRLLVTLTGLLLCAIFVQAQNVNLFVPPASCDQSIYPAIWCESSARNDDTGSYIDMTTESDLGNPTLSTAYVFFRDPVQMLDPATGQAASFNASLTFAISGTDTDAGDGMAFVMFEDENFRGYPGGALGVYRLDGTQGTKTFCIEYDTFMDPPSWIDYDSPRSTLEVRIANATQAKPTHALLRYQLNISEVVAVNMMVGISASSGSGSGESNSLYSFNFSTSGLPSRSSSSPSPSPPPSPPPEDGGSDAFAVRLGALLGAGLILGLSFLCCCICFVLAKRLRKISYGDLDADLRGTIMSTGKAVAVKRVAKDLKGGLKLFMSELSIVSRLRHRNLVKLLGWCVERGHLLVVYELMPNGSLDKLLFRQNVVLPWTRRLAVMRGVAAGLAYLHTGYTQQVLHRDIKSSNVMLDEDFNARLGDFGLSRLVEHSKNLVTTEVAGTVGYIAPEAFEGWKATDKMDVYAFGALILEVACGRRPIDTGLPPEEILLVDWVWRCNAQGHILKAADPRLAGEFPELEMKNILQMGLLCSHPDPLERPSIHQVELFLAGDMSLPTVPLDKPVAVYTRPTQVASYGEISNANVEQRSFPSLSSVTNSRSWRTPEFNV